MKILLVSPYFIDSFPQKLSMGSAVKQAQMLSVRHQVTVLTTGRSKKTEKINPNLIVKSIPGLLLPDPINYVVAPAIFPAFLKQIKKQRPDMVMVSKYMFFTSLLIPLAKLKGLKIITTTDTFPGINWFSRSRLSNLVMWFYTRLIGLPLLWLSDKVILLYPGLESLARRYHLNHVTILNGVDDSYFKKQSLPKDIEKPRGEFWVGFVGRPESIKGYDLALKAAAYFAKTNPRVKFVFVGGNLRPHTQANKIYLGFRQDTKNIYQLFDCLILPSYAEGLPNVLLEAMAQDVPCIASNVGGVKFIINHRKNGYLFSPGDIHSLIRYIGTVRNLKISPSKIIWEKYRLKKTLKSYEYFGHH